MTSHETFMVSQITATPWFVQKLVQANCKESAKASYHWPLCEGICQYPLDSSHQLPVLWKTFTGYDVIMQCVLMCENACLYSFYWGENFKHVIVSQFYIFFFPASAFIREAVGQHHWENGHGWVRWTHGIVNPFDTGDGIFEWLIFPTWRWLTLYILRPFHGSVTICIISVYWINSLWPYHDNLGQYWLR